MCKLTLTRYCRPILTASALLFVMENTLPKASAIQFISPIGYDCGPAYLEIDAHNETGFISSPNDPRSLPSQVRCIWVLKAPKGCHVQLRLNYIRSQITRTGACIDYLEVRSRSSTTWRPMLSSCHLANPEVIVSDERFLWLKFITDQSNSSEGFNAEWSTTCDGNIAKENNPVCSSDEHSCPNLECIRIGYLCDERNDCGCTRTGCDEVDCPHNTPLTEAERLGIGFSAGLFTFILIYHGCKFLIVIHVKFQQRQSTGRYG